MESQKKMSRKNKSATSELGEDQVCVGETLVLENGREWICYRKVRDEGQVYLCLMSPTKPREFMFAKALLSDGDLSLKVVRDEQTLQRLKQLVQSKPWDVFMQYLFPRRRIK